MSIYNLQVENSIKNIGEEEYRKIWQADPHKICLRPGNILVS